MTSGFAIRGVGEIDQPAVAVDGLVKRYGDRTVPAAWCRCRAIPEG